MAKTGMMAACEFRPIPLFPVNALFSGTTPLPIHAVMYSGDATSVTIARYALPASSTIPVVVTAGHRSFRKRLFTTAAQRRQLSRTVDGQHRAVPQLAHGSVRRRRRGNVNQVPLDETMEI